MTLWVDNQLPLALARYLAASGLECAHVQDVGLTLNALRRQPLHTRHWFTHHLPEIVLHLQAQPKVSSRSQRFR